MIIWQTARTAQRARPGQRVPTRRASQLDQLTIDVDTRERYPYKFAGRPVERQRTALPVGDYAIRRDDQLIAAVERKTPEDFTVSSAGCPGFSGGEERGPPAGRGRYVRPSYYRDAVLEPRSNRNVVYVCRYHVVWCPKYRRPVLTGDVERRLNQLVPTVVAERGAELEALEVVPDHVHLLVGVDPQFGIHRLIKHVKGCTSRVLREEFPSLRSRLPCLWTNSYFVATAGGAPLEGVRPRYARNPQ